KLNTAVAMGVAIAATFMAVANVKGGNVDQAMAKTQVEIVDTWSYYQAKSTKQSLAEASIGQLTLERARVPDEQKDAIDKGLAGYRAKFEKYEKDKNDLTQKVEKLQKEYDRLNVKDDQFDMSEALLSVGIALLGITALTQKKWMLIVAGVFAAFGFAVGLAGFVGWSFRPAWLADLLGA
ncbi:MAG TPA: DUF4337 domain-containing protein, partial [Labilithrix sp.]